MTSLQIRRHLQASSLQNGWQVRTVLLSRPLLPALQPGQWLAHEHLPLAFLDQPDARTLQLIVPDGDNAETLSQVEIHGTRLTFPPPVPFILVGHGLPGLGGILTALRGRSHVPHCKGILLNLSELETLPFQPVPSRFWSPDLPADMIATLPLIEDWGWPARLIHPHMPGCGEYEWQTLRDQLPQDWTLLETGTPT